MHERQRLGSAVLVANNASHRPAGRQIGHTDEADTVVLPNALVVIRILECKRQQPLLFQIRLVNACEAAGDHRATPAEKPRGERGVLPAAAFAVIEIADHHPAGTVRMT